ncbi:MAG: DUF1573 domain-containing protein [Bacteroidales bacterium]|nr:DUF1573 domain-containing protein [Bacteroidales bacterium]MDD6581855.1 DUF1573 domain-containing protein [Bacteroidales bacterium]
MKARHIFIVIVLVCGLGMLSANAQTTKTVTGAEISFDKSTLNFGTLNVGDVKVGTFTFTNTGKKPLILDNVVSNCDCTVLDWSKKPVMPGKTGTIKATYTAKNSGKISKWVTVMSNAETDRVILRLAGEVK